MSIDGTIRLPEAPVPGETVTGGLYDVLAAKGRPEPGRGPEVLAELSAAAAVLDETPAILTQLGGEQLTDLMGVLLRLQARAGQVATLAAADATENGTVLASDAAGTQQWVSGCATTAGVSLEARDAKTMTVIAQGCREARNRVVTAAVRDGACSLLTARKVLEQTGRVAKILPTLAREDIQAWFIQLDPAWGARGVDELTRALRARHEPDALDAEDAELEEEETLSWSKLSTGMWRLTADLAPDTAALIKQAITAASAPRAATKGGTSDSPATAGNHKDTSGDTDDGDESRMSADDGDGDGAGQDTATAGTDTAAGNAGYGGSFGPLHYGPDDVNDSPVDDTDSLDDDFDIDLTGWFTNNDDGTDRGAATDTDQSNGRSGDSDEFGAGSGSGSGSGERVPDPRSPGKRRVDALVDLMGAGAKVANGDGTGVGAAATLLVTLGLADLLAGVGAATTITGDTLDPSTARRVACDADLIPIVLGRDSEPLDVGGRYRLVTGGMRAAVVFRDRGCTFPGCDRPPGFCDVHHLRPWWAGGDTSLSNSAMLCHRHHQIVHRGGYYATTTPTGVVWDLTEGAMPGWTNTGYKAAQAAASAAAAS